MGRIILVMMSESDERILEMIEEGLERAVNRSIEVRVKAGKLEHAYDIIRSQYKSPRLLSRLRRMKEDHDDKIIGLVDVDLYSPGFDFVFGEADVTAGVATVSLYRLRPEYYGKPPDSTLLAERAVKEATHELGHLYGLGHCQDPDCVMHFSTSLGDVDKKSKMICMKCTRRLKNDQ